MAGEERVSIVALFFIEQDDGSDAEHNEAEDHHKNILCTSSLIFFFRSQSSHLDLLPTTKDGFGFFAMQVDVRRVGRYENGSRGVERQR